MKNESYKQFLPVCNYVKFPVPLMSLWNHSSLATYGYQLWKQPSLNSNNNGGGNENVFLKKAIRHLHISHNTPCLPPTILHNLCSSFLLGITAIPKEIENNAYAKFWGANKGHFGRCACGEWVRNSNTTTLHKNCRFLFLNVDNNRYGPKENFAKICQIK